MANFSSSTSQPVLPSPAPFVSLPRADYFFFGSLMGLASLPLILILVCQAWQAWRSRVRSRQIQLLEKLWLLTAHPKQ